MGEGEDHCNICSPVLTVDTGGLDLTSFVTLVGISTDSRNVNLFNEGDQDLDITDISITNDLLASCGTFTLTGWGGSKTLRPGSSTSITISYRATGSCIDLDQSSLGWNILTIDSNDPHSPYVAALAGVALGN